MKQFIYELEDAESDSDDESDGENDYDGDSDSESESDESEDESQESEEESDSDSWEQEDPDEDELVAKYSAKPVPAALEGMKFVKDEPYWDDSDSDDNLSVLPSESDEHDNSEEELDYASSESED